MDVQFSLMTKMFSENGRVVVGAVYAMDRKERVG